MPTSPDNQTIATRAGKNYAPLQPLIDLAKRSQGNGKIPQNSLCDALKPKFAYYSTHEQVTWRDVYAAAQLVDLMIQGKPPAKRNPNTGLWIPQGMGNSAIERRWINTMRFYEKMLLARWQSSNPDVIIKAASEDDRDRVAAKNANPVLDGYERRFFTNTFSEREGGMALRSGCYIHHVFYDGSQKAIRGLRRVMTNAELTIGQGDGYCGDCEYQGEGKEFEPSQVGPLPAYVCPRCQSTATEVQPPAQAQLPSRGGQEEVYTGDIALELWPLQALRWDLTGPPEESSWLIHRQRSSLARVRALLGPLLLSADSSDIGLDSLERLAYTGVPISGRSSGGDRKPSVYRDPVNVEEMYLDSSEVADITLTKPEKTVDGEELPVGKPLSELFPDGLVVCGLNGMSVITGIYAESHRKSVVTGYWHRNPHSGIGDGVGDAVEIEKRANTIDSQFIAGMQAYSTPGFLHVKGVLEDNERTYLGTPNVNFAIDTSGLPADMRGDLGKLVKPAYEPRSVPVQMMQYVQEFLRGAMQLAFGVTEFSSGLPGMAGQNDTATGAQIEQEVSRMMSTPTLQGKAATRVKDAEIVIGLFREHMVLPQAFTVPGRIGRSQFKRLSAMDIKGALAFEAVPNSEVARHLYEKIRDLDGFYAVFGGFPGYLQARQTNPQEVLEEARRRSVKLEGSDYDEMVELCLNRLDQMREGVGRAHAPEELLLLIQPPISQFESLLEVQTKWWQDYLNTPQGQAEPMIVRSAIEQIIQGQFWNLVNQGAAVGFGQGVAQAAQQAPAALGEQLLQGGDNSGQQSAQEHGQALELKGADIQEAEAQRAHEATESELERRHELSVKDRDLQMKVKELAAQKQMAQQQRSVAT
jgi:hypothetical protein